MRIAGIDCLETGIERTFPDGVQGNGRRGGAPSAIDVSQETPGDEGICLNGDDLSPEIVCYPVPLDGFHPSGVKGDGGRTIVRHGRERSCLIAGIGPYRPGGQNRKGYDDLDNRTCSVHGRIIE